MQRLVPILATVFFFALAACRPAAVVTDAPAPTTAAVTADAVPSGTTIDVRLNESIGVDVTNVGDTFTADVIDPLRTPDGVTVLAAGTTVEGRVTGVSPAADGQPAAVRVDFDRIYIGGQAHPFEARVVDTGARTVEDAVLSTEAAIGAAAGAAVGLIIEGGLLSALVGGALGAGVGTAIALGRGEVDPVLTAGTRLTLQTTQRLAVN